MDLDESDLSNGLLCQQCSSSETLALGEEAVGEDAAGEGAESLASKRERALSPESTVGARKKQKGRRAKHKDCLVCRTHSTEADPCIILRNERREQQGETICVAIAITS